MSEVKQLSYLGYLQQSTSDVIAEEQLFQVQEQKSHWEVSIAKTKSELAKAKRSLNTAFATASLEMIVSYTDRVESLERGLDIAQKAFAVLFPVEEVVA